jgi:hypothetical protein
VNGWFSRPTRVCRKTQCGAQDVEHALERGAEPAQSRGRDVDERQVRHRVRVDARTGDVRERGGQDERDRVVRQFPAERAHEPRAQTAARHRDDFDLVAPQHLEDRRDGPVDAQHGQRQLLTVGRLEAAPGQDRAVRREPGAGSPREAAMELEGLSRSADDDEPAREPTALTHPHDHLPGRPPPPHQEQHPHGEGDGDVAARQLDAEDVGEDRDGAEEREGRIHDAAILEDARSDDSDLPRPPDPQRQEPERADRRAHHPVRQVHGIGQSCLRRPEADGVGRDHREGDDQDVSGQDAARQCAPPIRTLRHHALPGLPAPSRSSRSDRQIIPSSERHP